MDGRTARAVLGVPEHAPLDVIRRAYRTRARATHPDHGGDRDAFEAVRAAYDALRAAPPGPVHRRLNPRPNPFAWRPPAPIRFEAFDGPRPAHRLPGPPRRPFAAVLADVLAGRA